MALTKITSSLSGAATQPPCFYSDCTRSGFYELPTGCPQIALCLQSIENNTTFQGGGDIRHPDIDESASKNMSCDLQSINTNTPTAAQNLATTSSLNAQNSASNLQSNSGSSTGSTSGTSTGSTSTGSTSGTSTTSIDFTSPTNLMIGGIIISIIIAIIYVMVSG